MLLTPALFPQTGVTLAPGFLPDTPQGREPPASDLSQVPHGVLRGSGSVAVQTAARGQSCQGRWTQDTWLRWG